MAECGHCVKARKRLKYIYKDRTYLKLISMKTKQIIKESALALAIISGAQAATAHQYWLSPNGTGDGKTEATASSDAKTIIESLMPGDTCWVKPGKYDVKDMINVRRGGTRYKRIWVLGTSTAERAVFDYTNAPHNGGDDQKQYRGVLMNPTAQYWYWRDIDFTKAPDNGMKLESNYCVIERCNFYRCGDTGLQLGFDKDGNGGNNRNQRFVWGRYNQIINCDSYFNYDIQSHGGNADGFANKLYPGPGNEWHGDRCWNNSDDGWDLYYAAYPALIENCWAINNGYLEDGSVGVNGNGFKQGGNKQGGGSYGAHIFLNDVAAYNLYHGFDQNNHNEGNWIINCTAFKNKQVNFRFNCDVQMLGNTVFHLRNCLGFDPGEANHRFGDMWPDSKFTNWQDILHLSPQYNMGKGTDPETGQEYVRLSAKDWPAYDDQFEDVSLETAISARQANGELPLKFARPKASSIFVDKGTPIENFKCSDVFQDQYKLSGKYLEDYGRTVTLPYAGKAPDYGAYEAGWERPAFNLETLPVNDGTLVDPDILNNFDGVWYQKKTLIDDYLFQDAELSDNVKTYITEASSSNAVQPDYYGKSGTYPNKIGKLYGGGTKGAYKLANSGGYIILTLPSLSQFVSDVYGGGKSTTLKVEYRKQGESTWTEGGSETIDQRIVTFDFLAYGVPATPDPIEIKLSSTGSNDAYLTSLTVNGFEKAPTTAIHNINNNGADVDMQCTSNGVIVYGDIADINVYAADGSQVAGSSLSQFCNLSTVGKGMYVVRATTKDGRTVTRKIIRK